MPVIKRYPNRKLYDTEAKQYVTLDGIARLIREGEEVRVLDHASGEDLTALTLSQVIFEQEKKRGGFLPQSVLTGLIRAGGETMSTLQRTLATPLGLARQVDEEIEHRLQTLIGRGELAAEEGRRLRDQLMGQHHRPGLRDKDLQQALDRRGVPTQRDLRGVLDQLEALSAKLEGLTSLRDQNQPLPPDRPADEDTIGPDEDLA
jgi:polyhydroxyalkanoate synthesis repressor PhaR